MGLPLSAGALVFETLGVRPLRTSWLIVGTLVFSVLSGVAASGHSLVALPRRPGLEEDLQGGEGEALIVGSHSWGLARGQQSLGMQKCGIRCTRTLQTGNVALVQ